MVANIYIDGFNLYYGAVKGTPWKWLNVECLCRRLLPRDTLNRIRYFTARITARPEDPRAPQRQQTYLRALQTIPILTVHEGYFLATPVRMPLVHPTRNRRTVEVIRTEEKGSDVNLATYLLLDVFEQDCETAVIISNDSDLLEPVRAVKRRFGMPVGIINPHPPRRRSRALLAEASFFKQIRAGALAACQFPQTLTDISGDFSCPSEWTHP